MRKHFAPALLALALAACGSPSVPTSPTGAITPLYSESSFREAARISAVAVTEARQRVRAGLLEGDIKATIDSVFARLGGTPPAFSHIVAAGRNGLDLHYGGSDGVLTDGELVLIDIGATSNHLSSDVSRTYPVSGRFNKRQRELYELVLAVQEAVAASPNTLDMMDRHARGLLLASPLRALDASGVERSMDTFFTHSLCHFIGHDVHGVETGYSTWEPLRPGQVFAIEPGLYIPSEGIAIRIEDTYLVALNHTLTCLSCDAPKQIAAIEQGLGIR